MRHDARGRSASSERRATMIQLIAISLLVVVSPAAAASYYDYIVIGAGVAGSVAASRLSEDAGITVLLLEAGAEPNIVLRSPAATFLATDSDRDWRYLSEPLEYCGDFVNNRQMRLSTGKVLGGGSILNAITWVRESRKGFKMWKDMGISGWSYEENLPYFIKSEKVRIRKFKNSKGRGHDGPIRIAMSNFQSDIPQSIINAGGEAGYRTDFDYNDKFRLGFFRGQQNLDKGMRFDAVRAYLDPVRSRKNLEIRTRSLVKKVIFDDTMRATGVEYEDHDGDTHIVYVNYEVVMAAGGLSTPKIILQSGIGPRDRLKAVGIKQILELPVGKNLQDHFGCFGHQYSINRDLISFGVSTVTGAANVSSQSPGAGLSNFMNWGAFLNTRDGPHDPEDHADVQVMGVEMAFDKMQHFFRSYFNVNKTHWDETFGARKLSVTASVFAYTYLLDYKTIGEIYLKSSDPKDKPIVDIQYFKDPEEVQILIRAFKFIDNLMTSKTMSKFKPKHFAVKIPGCPYDPDPQHDGYLECMIRAMPMTIYHYVGTMRMGNDTDRTSVVDEQLRMRGVRNVRVVDGSVFPRNTMGNPMATIYMVAERGADLIRGRRLLPPIYDY